MHQPQHIAHVLGNRLPLGIAGKAYRNTVSRIPALMKLLEADRLGGLFDLPRFPVFGKVMQIGLHFLRDNGIPRPFTGEAVALGHPVNEEFHRLGTGNPHAEKVVFEVLHASGLQ